jgi:hypothetical protein
LSPAPSSGFTSAKRSVFLIQGIFLPYTLHSYLAVNTVAIMESTDLMCSQKPPTAIYLEPSEYVLIVFMYGLLQLYLYGLLQLYLVIQPIKLWDHY